MSEINSHEHTATQKTSISSYLAELGRFLFLALIIIVPLRLFIAEPFIVSGSSMIPSFYDKEYLIIDKLTYYTRQPLRGDVVVFKNPRNESEYYIKRIIGLPGETVMIENNSVMISNNQFPQGLVLNEPYLAANMVTQGGVEPVTLGAQEYFVMGDNRLASSDSRLWGVLPADEIIGKVRVRVLPISRFSIFNQLPVYTE